MIIGDVEQLPLLCYHPWGFHSEHYCIVPRDDHDFPVHFCECGAEQDVVQ